jgi:hypothetical protein
MVANDTVEVLANALDLDPRSPAASERSGAMPAARTALVQLSGVVKGASILSVKYVITLNMTAIE